MTDEGERRAARVKHIDPAALAELRTALEREGSGLSLHAIDVIDYVEHLRELPDRTLAKDFLALYTSARALTSAWHPAVERAALWDQVEHLGLHVRRLAPLYDDVRMQLNLQLATDRARIARDTGQQPHTVRVLQLDGSVSVECDHTFKGTRACVHCGTTVDELIARTRAAVAAMQHRPGETVAEAARRHGLEFLPDGSARLIDPPVPFVLQGAVPARPGAALRPGQDTDPSLLDDLRLPSLLPDGVLHATPDELADVIARQLDEHEGRGIIALRGISELDAALEPDDELSVPITLGPTLRPRIEALVATTRLGRDIEHVVQTLFVLGMLEAEGQDPQAHVGAPHSHVSAEALFVRFGMPHEGDGKAAQQRAAVLRQLFLDLVEWCDEADPLRPSLLAALEHLPR
jgi:hypothetical protein